MPNPVKHRIASLDQAIAVIRDSDTIATSGFVGIGTPDELLIGLERRFLDTGHPRDLTLVFAAGQGDGKSRGLNRLGHEGLLRRVIGGHWGLIPKVARLAVEGKIEAYNLPQGCISHLYRDIAAHKPGTITKVGLRTFVDPRQDGGRINATSEEAIVSLLEMEGREWLFYKAFPIHVALLRGTTADAAGNVTMEREALTLDNLAMAMAAKNSGGLVIVQVERMAAAGSLSPRAVQLPGALVDCVVVASPEHHEQTYATPYNPAYSGELRLPLEDLAPLDLDERKLIGRRCAFDLPMGGIVNLGIGMPEAVAAVANEEKVLPHITLTAEPGIIGGLPQSGLNFGAAINAEAIVHQNQQFDFYDGGGLDMACLGMAEVDAQGNVNVSRFGARLAGAGGFINISQNARRVVFAGTFTAGGLEIALEDGTLRILKEGHARKFVAKVQQITFNGTYAAELGRPVSYVTERCVFRRTAEGMELVEVAPGIDLERDILAHMAFKPILRSPRTMDPRIFRPEPMGLADTLLDLAFSDRISYDQAQNVMFLNFEGLSVRTREDVERVRRSVEQRCKSIGRKMAVVVNYDAFRLDPLIADHYAEMVRYMVKRYYTRVSRYTTSAFMRLKLGDALVKRRVAPHIFETKAEAQAFLRDHKPN